MIAKTYGSGIAIEDLKFKNDKDVHNGAGMVIARRSYGFKEKAPKILKDKLVKDLDKFNKKNEWSKWNEINKNIKGKVGENPDLWLVNRKKILGIVS